MNDGAALVPFDIPGVPPEVRDNVFAPLDQTLNRHIDALSERPRSETGDVSLGFFKDLRETLDGERFRSIQTAHLAALPPEGRPDHLKYIDPVTWTADKLATSFQLGLHAAKPMRIIDIGAGPAHFNLVARYFGHAVTSTELEKFISGASPRADFYRDMCSLHGAEPLSLKIEPMTPIRNVGSGYDLMTIFMGIFNNDGNQGPWTEGMWRFFLKDLRANILSPDGGLHMRLSRQYTPDDIWSFLKSRATSFNDRNLDIYFDDLIWVDAL